MNKYVAADGTVLTDEVIAQLAREAELGFPNSKLSRDEVAPWKRREPMETHSIRVPARLWALLELRAAEEQLSTSEFARQALAQSLLGGRAA
ncbi:ribbon-helix-helix protein, CopG family [Leucobacter insecticola]|uniref:Ribbon-helix-helix protein, CopG family n=1 Tax=Leucobacter insecticola TaxID=2714934 RepID=A0A6G8FHH9_9MICO|nr:ribbon-helix-helix protein, CopG family [Leucobacter insecticola]